MSLHIFDTAQRQLRPFEPVKPGHASIYLCGATPQTIPHIGHVRSAVAFDIVRRWLASTGHDVAFVRNVTDIDDKILAKAVENKRPWWEWVSTHERAFAWAYDQLGVLPPSIEPRATGHITQMVELMQRLIDRGYAYAAKGDVYFKVAHYERYGELSGHKLDDVHQGESKAEGKEDPRDFTLWKAAKPGEPSWPTPWGPGRPGWHLECSAMAHAYLGEEFDIHGGGMDLMFPHHENEIAQSVCSGDSFARYWMHNGWVTMAGEKMSKSLGNVLSVPTILSLVRPIELRYYLGSAHYRSMLEYSQDALLEAAAGFTRIESFLMKAAEYDAVREWQTVVDSERTTRHDPLGALLSECVPTEFTAALDEDFAVPAALAVVHNTVRAGNTALAAGDTDAVIAIGISVRAMCDILGIDPLATQWQSGRSTSEDENVRDALDALLAVKLQQRAQAKSDKDWAMADQIRDELSALGIVVEDSAEGSTWKFQ